MEMHLKVFSPIGIVLDTPVTQVDFEAIDGFYTMLPKHMDMVSALKPSILSYQAGEKSGYVACNKGVIVKKGKDISVSTKLAILGTDLKQLEKTIEVDFKEMEQQRKEANLAMAKLEIGLTKGLMALKKEGESYGGI